MRPQTQKIYECLGFLKSRADMESAPTTKFKHPAKPKFTVVHPIG